MDGNFLVYTHPCPLICRAVKSLDPKAPSVDFFAHFEIEPHNKSLHQQPIFSFAMAPKTPLAAAGAKRKASSSGKPSSQDRIKKARTATGKQRVNFDNDDVKSDSDSSDDSDNGEGGADIPIRAASGYEGKGKANDDSGGLSASVLVGGGGIQLTGFS